MHIWVDADACPIAVKDILFRAAKRTETKLTLVANQPMRIPRDDLIDFILVPAGFDVADGEIVKHVEKNDLVITADIPLAAEVITKGATVLDPRGELLTEENVRSRLSVRNFMEQLRESGVQTGGPKKQSQKDVQEFANSLDRILNKAKR
ncbi:MAG: YaiI/YqxD family protein [Calditrichia bacterium]